MPQKKVNNMAERKNEAVWLEKYGRWQIKVQVEGERRTFTSKVPGRKGKIEAEKKADAWLATGTRNSNARFGQVWDTYLNRLKETRGEKSTGYLHAEYFGRLYLKPRIEHKKLSSITPQDWQDCIDYAWRERDLSRKTLQDMRGTITAFWRYLKRSRIAFDAPDDFLIIPRQAKVGKRTIVQPQNLQVVFETDGHEVRGRMYQPHYLYAWRFALATGMRPGEVIGLQNDDIQGDYLIISSAINVHDVETRGKNEHAQRTFQLPQLARKVLDDQMNYLISKGIRSKYVFPALDGGPASERNVYKSWRKFCATLGIPPTSLYEQRHTFVSVNYEIPDPLLKQMVGHGQSMDTRRQYGHELDGQKAITASLVDEALNKAMKR